MPLPPSLEAEDDEALRSVVREHPALEPSGQQTQNLNQFTLRSQVCIRVIQAACHEVEKSASATTACAAYLKRLRQSSTGKRLLARNYGLETA